VETSGAGPATQVRLESDYLPPGLRLSGDPLKRAIRSVRLAGEVPSEGHGIGRVWLDTREAELNAFGDVVRRMGPEPEPIEAEWRFVRAGGVGVDQPPHLQDADASRGFRLYDLVFPGGVLHGQLQLVLGTTNLGPHRLLALDAATSEAEHGKQKPAHIVPLQGNPSIASILPDKPMGRAIELNGYYTSLDGRIRRIGVRGTLGGAGAVELDPNYITFDGFGEPIMFTAMGYRPHEITWERADSEDPLRQGRALYWAISKDPKNQNRVAVVVGGTEAGSHRVLLYRGDKVAFVVPVAHRERRRHEIEAGKYAGLPEEEQKALAELERTIGYGFQCKIEDGRTIALTFLDEMRGALPAGILARLRSVQTLRFNGGRFPMAGLADLEQLAELKSLGFSSSVFEAGSLAAVRNLTQLESLHMWGCRGIGDEDLSHLTGLRNLKWLSFYVEEDPDDRTSVRITDVGVAHLKGLAKLEYLDLYGHDVSDASLPVLIEMKELEELALGGQGFSDAGLRRLIALPKLRRLRLLKTGVSAETVEQLKKQRPELEIQLHGLSLSG
jgi:hypothetical protein